MTLMGNMKNACISVGKPEQTKPLGRYRRGWKTNIKICT
jgi:hypothetical protein